jgi:catechol 2,3-dioxygenase-like lactoylglutathione lyase family enzyme
MNFSVEHLGLPARNPEALKDWYLKTLDGKLVYADGQTPPAFFVKLPGGVVLEIYQSNKTLRETADNKLSGWRHVALRVDSIASAKTKLESRGVKFGAKIAPAGGGGNVLYFEDGEGNLLHLVERTPESPLH